MVVARSAPAQGEWTLDDWRDLPEDGNRYEVIDGVLYVTPTPLLVHQEAVARLHLLLSPYLLGSRAGHLMFSPAEIAFEPKLVVQPDLFVTPLFEGRRPLEWTDISRLVLAIEVQSESTAARDRGAKRRIYQQHADEYWIADLDGRVVERWRPNDERPEVLDEVLTWQPAGSEQPLVIDLRFLFREIRQD